MITSHHVTSELAAERARDLRAGATPRSRARHEERTGRPVRTGLRLAAARLPRMSRPRWAGRAGC
jgi:hypothetical protein